MTASVANVGKEPAGEVPVGAPAGTESAIGGGQLKTKWEEFDEKAREKYVIEILDAVVEEDTVVYTKLSLRRYYFPLYPYGNYASAQWEVEWDGADKLVIESHCVRNCWNGTGSEWLGRLTVETYIPETPWFFDYDSLAERIERDGVEETIESIVEDVLYLAKDAIGAGEG